MDGGLDAFIVRDDEPRVELVPMLLALPILLKLATLFKPCSEPSSRVQSSRQRAFPEIPGIKYVVDVGF
jgi:hypothetical protein